MRTPGAAAILLCGLIATGCDSKAQIEYAKRTSYKSGHALGLNDGKRAAFKEAKQSSLENSRKETLSDLSRTKNFSYSWWVLCPVLIVGFSLGLIAHYLLFYSLRKNGILSDIDAVIHGDLPPPSFADRELGLPLGEEKRS